MTCSEYELNALSRYFGSRVVDGIEDNGHVFHFNVEHGGPQAKRGSGGAQGKPIARLHAIWRPVRGPRSLGCLFVPLQFSRFCFNLQRFTRMMMLQYEAKPFHFAVGIPADSTRVNNHRFLETEEVQQSISQLHQKVRSGLPGVVCS